MADDPTKPIRNYEHEMRTFEFRMMSFGTHMQAVVGLANVAITSIILANSAAAGAVLAFLAVMWGKEEFAAVAIASVDTIKIFAVGVTAGMLAAGAGYFAQYCYMRVDMGDEGREETDKPKHSVWEIGGIVLHVIAVIGGAVGIVSFPFGAWGGLDLLLNMPK